MSLNPPSALAGLHLSSSSLHPALVGGSGTPANIDDMYVSASVSAQGAAASGGDDGSSSSRWPLPSPWPNLLSDSGASIHLVGDSRLLSNLRDAPSGKCVRIADGKILSITKIGDIQMTTADFTIPGVHLAPGLKSDLISVRELTRSRICTLFDGDMATLYAGAELVGVAVAPEEKNGLYVLQSLSVPKIAAASSRSSSRSGSNQPKQFTIEVNAKTIVKAKKEVKAKANNKEAAREGAKNDSVPFDSPAMGTRSKVAALASSARNGHTK